MLSALVLHPASAGAQSPSDPTGMTTRSEIADYLGRTYDEEPVAGGLGANGAVLEVFTSPDGESWTLVMTFPDGRSQVVAVGEDWLSLAKARGEGI
ncbi:MAG: hypothetical protein JJ899_15020 [Alphaproteobacteria bacterium]|nr:hypothetical protein [Alphaproteobacteria bacterium]